MDRPVAMDQVHKDEHSDIHFHLRHSSLSGFPYMNQDLDSASNNIYNQQHQMNLLPQKNDPVLQQLLTQIASMQANIKELSTNNADPKRTTVGKLQTNNPKTGQPWKRYCWSCGCCTHWSKYCSHVAPVLKKPIK